jgi:hypothetical protein
MKGYRTLFIFFMLSFYGFGAGVLDSFAMYHSWLFVGEAEFATMHQEAGARIISFYVLPLVVCTIFNVLLFWYRPAALPKSLVWIAFSALLTVWLSSVFIQIPIQFQLDHGKDTALLNKLILTDWIRVIGWLIFIGIVIKMGWTCFVKQKAF